MTWSAGVPTIWLGILQALDASPGRFDLSHMKGMFVGGSAVPRALIAAFQRHGLTIIQGWGMTETSPVASTSDLPHDLAASDLDTQLDLRATAGLPLARARRQTAFRPEGEERHLAVHERRRLAHGDV